MLRIAKRLFSRSTSKFSSKLGDKAKGFIGTRVFDIKVPLNALQVTAVRASGPGGQNVNKVSTKIDARLDIDKADWIPDKLKERLCELNANRLLKGNQIRITASEHRTQNQNLNEVYNKLQQMIDQASYAPEEKKKTQKPLAAIEHRIRKKKRRSEVKRLRQKSRNDE